MSMLLIYLFVYSVSTATDCKVDWPTGAREIYPADAFIARPLLNLYNLHINIALGKKYINLCCKYSVHFAQVNTFGPPAHETPFETRDMT